MNYQSEYERWLQLADSETVAELKTLTDKNEIEERFYKTLEFGTGGLRGIIGSGTNRMNKYVIRQATQGLANYILKQGNGLQDRGVVIAFDSRNFSDFFAKQTALVLCENGIKTYLFESLRPTPELSFAVRHLNAAAGIVVTASHNPPKYNGFKVYFEDGGQLPPHVSDEMLKYIEKINIFDVKVMDEKAALDKNLLEIIGDNVDTAYLNAVQKQAIHTDLSKDGYRLVYTPIHGSGNIPVRKILEMTGFEDVILVDEQVEPNGDFPTVTSPNPENKECFNQAIALAKKNNVDLIIGTDPDCDRVGIVVKDKNGSYVTMTGNQVGALLTHYIVSAKLDMGQLPANGAVISTIVSTKMTKEICKDFNIKFFETLTGFKFIGELIHKFEIDNSYTYLFGFEESYGYLAGTHARDKDAVVGAMLIAEMGLYYSKRGLTLYDAMENLYEKYGYFVEDTISVTMEGKDGAGKIKEVMSKFRDQKPTEIAGFKVTAIRDYKESKRYIGDKTEDISLIKSDVLYFELENGTDFVVRPSGTEPKIKFYYLAKGTSIANAREIITKISNDIDSKYLK